MLVKRFKFKRNNDKGGFHWTAGSEIERTGFHGGFTAVGVHKLGTVAVVPFGLTVSPESQDVAVNRHRRYRQRYHAGGELPVN